MGIAKIETSEISRITLTIYKLLLDFDNRCALDGLCQTAKVLVHFRFLNHWSCVENV